MGIVSFEKKFCALTGNDPFPWQTQLYRRFIGDVEGGLPTSCSLPTGLGKTSVVAIWIIALADGASLPRRLVYVVNRRTVVDQTTHEVESYRKALATKSDLNEVSDALKKLCAFPITTEVPVLALSTLRGQFADNREWAVDPARPSVIVGTVDMIGSRLLFNGYGIGFKGKPLHAGFLGQDVILVHDEAHLEPAFQNLISSIKAEQQRSGEYGAFHVIELTATSRDQSVDVFGLTDEERSAPESIPDPTQPLHVVWRRQKATKHLTLVPIADEKQTPERIAEIAFGRSKDAVKNDTNSAVLIFVRLVKDVSKVYAKLKNLGVNESHIGSLIGTIRGKERDDFTRADPIFMRFLPKKSRHPNVVPASGTVYLICTSAGEVGVDISADHLVCDLSPFDSMAQRFGRVNRYGDRPDTRIDVVHPVEFGKVDKKTRELKADAIATSRSKTLQLLKDLPAITKDLYDASPAALTSLPAEARHAAFTPAPVILPTSDILYDAWAMTSIRSEMPGRPDVAPFLHGIADEIAQTSIAWRDELDLLKDDENPTRALQSIFASHRIRPHETLTLNSYQLKDFFAAITKKREDLKATRVALLFARSLVLSTIGDLINNDGPLNADPTLVLPASLGYLNNGRLDDDANFSAPRIDHSTSSNDVADLPQYEPDYEPDRDFPSRLRVVIKREEERWTAEPLVSGTKSETMPAGPFATSSKLINDLRGNRYRVRLVQPIEYDSDDRVVRSLVMLSPLRRKVASEHQLLDEHVGDVVKFAKLLASKLDLSEPFSEALLFAAKWHDEGKRSKLWQRYIGRLPEEPDVAKSAEWRDPRILSGYRHEFGSLVRLEHQRTTPGHAGCDLPLDTQTRELALHLIAAHHGHARPHFQHGFDKEFSLNKCETTQIETMRRFARLQRLYGRWGLAYLESLLRAADAAASAGIETDDELEVGHGGDV